MHRDQRVERVVAERGGERELLLGRGDARPRCSGAPNCATSCFASVSIAASAVVVARLARSAPASTSRASATPRKPRAERRARLAFERCRDRRRQNTNAPDTAHSPGSAALSNTNVSDGSSRMVRSSFTAAALRVVGIEPRRRRRAPAPARGARPRPCPCAAPADRRCRRCRGARPSPARAAPDSSSPPRRSRAPARRRSHHQMAREALDQPAGAERRRSLPLRAPPTSGRRPGSPSAIDTVRIMAPNTSQCGGSSSGPSGQAELPAADQPAVDADRVRPVERDRLLGRRMRRERVGERRHAGVERAPRAAQRLVRLEHDGEFGEVEAADDTPACRRRAPRRSPCAWANASPTSRSVTRRKAGGRSSAGANGVFMRAFRRHVAPGFALSAWDNYNLAGAAASGRSAGAPQSRSEMAEKRTILVCSCEDTMPLDADAIERGCRGAEVATARQLCRAELERFRAPRPTAAAPVTVGCTQEAPLFAEVAGERRRDHLRQHPRDRRLVGRRRARPGRRWRRCSRPRPSRCRRSPFVSLTSEGVALIYGRDERAIEAGDAARRTISTSPC